MPIATRNLKVFLGGQELRYVRALHIDAEVGSAVVAKLELYVSPTWDADGNIHLDGVATLGPINAPGLPQGLRIRAMDLAGEVLPVMVPTPTDPDVAL